MSVSKVVTLPQLRSSSAFSHAGPPASPAKGAAHEGASPAYAANDRFLLRVSAYCLLATGCPARAHLCALFDPTRCRNLLQSIMQKAENTLVFLCKRSKIGVRLRIRRLRVRIVPGVLAFEAI